MNFDFANIRNKNVSTYTEEKKSGNNDGNERNN